MARSLGALPAHEEIRAGTERFCAVFTVNAINFKGGTPNANEA
jgi:hypothetical protein